MRSAAEPEPGKIPPSLWRSLFLSWICAFAALAYLSLLDTAAIALRGAGIAAIDAIACLGHSVGLALYVALLLACGATALAAAARPLGAIRRTGVRRAALGAAFGALGGLSAVLVLKPWESSYAPLPQMAGLTAAGIATGTVVALVGARLSRVARFAAGASIAASLFAADALAYPGLYPRFHDLAAWSALLAGALAAHSLLDRLGSSALRAAAMGVVAVGLVGQLATASRGQAIRAIGAAHGVVSPLVLRAVWACFDLDRDGFSALFGGGDCDDLDAEVNPGEREIPANGRDDNCNGVVDTVAVRRPAAGPRTPRAPAPDVYFLMLDGLRGAPGGAADEALERVASRIGAEGLAFRRAYTPYPSTRCAVLSVLASRHWRCRRPGCGGFLEAMAGRGYDVQIRMDARRFEVRPGARSILEATDQADDIFHVPNAGKRGWSRAIVDVAIDELRQEPDASPRLRWLHFLDTHFPWSCRGDACRTELDAYRTEASAELAEVERLLAALEESERGRRAVIVLLSDHGEEFGEHGGALHGAHLYEESVRVPLAIRLPGEPPRAIEASASTIDAVPTIAHYLGLKDEACWQGTDWLAAKDREPSGAARNAVVHSTSGESFGALGLPERFALLDGRLKLIRGIDENSFELYDIGRDPGELVDVFADRRADAKRLLGELALWLDRGDCADPAAAGR